MTVLSSKLFIPFATISLSAMCAPTNVTANPATVPAVLAEVSPTPVRQGSVLLQQDFNGATPAWEKAVAQEPVGTIDVAGSKEASGAAVLRVGGVGSGKQNAALSSGMLPVRNTETNLAKLTLSFDLSVSATGPVAVRIESFDAAKRRTGALTGTVYPAAPDFYQRCALDLSTMKPYGKGKFTPTAPFVQLAFAPSDATSKTQEVRIDNVEYARPAFYVSPKGDNKNDGLTEKTAFATPQRAIDAAKPGDIVLVMNGTYEPNSDQLGVVSFVRPGTPAAWISLKNYPGHHPVFSTVGAWNAVRIGQRGTKEEASKEAALAYLEIRGFHMRGDADIAKEKYADKIGKSSPNTSGNGVSITSRYESNIPHHIRVADNVIEYCAGGGLSGIGSDWITIENNTVRNNCWWSVYAGSGISFLDSGNFDAADNVYKSLIRNNIASGNRCFVAWGQVKRISDGNGIIVDTNNAPTKGHVYLGRTLVQSNLSFNNGGSGIHSYKSHRVDIINNTAYYNGASPELNWGQIFVQVADDVKVMNNILVSRPDQPINSVGKDGGDQNSTNIVRTHNIYFGGIAPKLTGDSDLIADPLFVNASTDFKVADFHLKPGSPAAHSGVRSPLVPSLDIDGKLYGTAPARGVYAR